MSALYEYFAAMGLGDWALVFFILSIFVDISPIKFNPLKFLISKIGKYFNESVDKKIDKFNKENEARIDTLKDEISKLKIDINKENATRDSKLNAQIHDIKKELAEQAKTQNNIIRSADEAELRAIKNRILDFSNRLSAKKKFSVEAYRSIMDDHARYEQIIEKYDDLVNGKISVEYNSILAHYNKYKESGEYLF